MESSKSDDAIHNNSSPILVQNNPQAQEDLNYDLLVEKTSNKDAQGIEHESDKDLTDAEVRDEKQGHVSTLATVETSQSVFIEDNQNVAKIDSWISTIHHGVSQRLENTSSKVLIDALLLDSRQQLGDVNAQESNGEHRVEKSSGEDSSQHDGKDWNVVAPEEITATSIMTSSGKKCDTSESRWVNMVDEHVTPHRKLSPEAPAFVPKSSSITGVSSPLHHGRQLILTSSNVQKISVSDKELIDALVSSNVEKLISPTPINSNKQLQVGGSSTFSPNQFAYLQDDDICEEGDEEDWFDHCFANAARNADVSPRQQCNNKKKHGRKNSWDGKVTGDFVPRHLPMRLSKQNHMTMSTNSTRSNNSKKK